MGAIVSVVLLPFISGFILITGYPYLKYRVASYSSYQLVIISVIFGLGLVFAASFILWVFSLISPSTHEFIHLGLNVIKSPLTDLIIDQKVVVTNASFLTVFISVLIVFWGRSEKKKDPEGFKLKIEKIRDKQLLDTAGPIEELFDVSKKLQYPVMITLKNRKVYIGLIDDMPPPFLGQKRHVKLLPLYSGFRDSETLHYEQDEDYGFFIMVLLKIREKKKELKASDMVEISRGDKSEVVSMETLMHTANHALIIDIDEIVTARLWVKGVFEVFRDSQKKPKSKIKPYPSMKRKND